MIRARVVSAAPTGSHGRRLAAHDPVGCAVGLALDRLGRLRDRSWASAAVVAAALLHDVRQLVREEARSLLALGLEARRPERDVAADRQSVGAVLLGELGALGVGVHADVLEREAEGRLHSLAGGRRQRPPAAQRARLGRLLRGSPCGGLGPCSSGRLGRAALS